MKTPVASHCQHQNCSANIVYSVLGNEVGSPMNLCHEHAMRKIETAILERKARHDKGLNNGIKIHIVES